MSELVGPNKTIIGISAKTSYALPLSMETSRSNLEDSAVTKAGQDSSEFVSGNKALGT